MAQWDWIIGKTIGALLIPPGILLLILLVGLALTWRRPPLARGLVAFTWVALYALSTSFVAGGLMRLLEPDPQDPAADASGQAIVVLGGGSHVGAPEYGGDTVNTFTLVRIRYGAHLHRLIKKPLLTSGGSHVGSPIPEARLMKQVLEAEFQVRVQWTDENSSNTLENARRSFLVLNPAGIKRIYLVTHAWHMPRARYAFEHAGFSVIPAPTAYTTQGTTSLLSFLPSAPALAQTSWFFHEVIGMAWYYLRISVGR
jgi:uncharacterized SAM-binding protein YcdF (DUF218 family)